MARVIVQNIRKFQKTLLKWYSDNGRVFPWRREGLGVFRLIVSEVLLQRTKAETVVKLYFDFFKTFSDWQDIALSRATKLQKALRPLGLHKQRAKRLKELAVEMLNRKGHLPEGRSELEVIPLFGQYLTNAVELLIFKRKSPLIDVNMSRVLERYFGERKMADIRYDPFLQNLARRVIDHPKSRDLNWAILDYAAIVCSARNPKCKTCGLASKCTYFRKNA